MASIKKPSVVHPNLKPNNIGLTLRDYEGSMSTLCAGCGHDSVTAAIVRAFYELDTPPHLIAKLSGIGCSSKTPTYFVGGAHGFNSAHGRMPSIATGANAANRDLTYIGISGDGDSLSIGLGQLCHAIRRNVNMLYVIENNGVYGLTKGQFSASADIGTKSKRGEANRQSPIDPVMLALTLGATFVARSFSGDKAQLVPMLKAGLAHQGFAIIDVISPCVTFNDHEGSTKSYLTRASTCCSWCRRTSCRRARDHRRLQPGRDRQRHHARRQQVRFSKVARTTTRPTAAASSAICRRARAEARCPPACSSSTRARRHARHERHGRHAAVTGALRGALPWQRRARRAAGSVSLGRRAGSPLSSAGEGKPCETRPSNAAIAAPAARS